MVTFRLVFRVSKMQLYSETDLQDVLRAGLSAMLQGEAVVVPAFGEIKAITLLGTGVLLPPCSF